MISRFQFRDIIIQFKYLATINKEDTPNNKHFYIGISKGEWKKRYYVHRKSFKTKERSNWTALTKKVWEIKETGKRPILKWNIITRAKPPENIKSKCFLCLEEKTRILNFKNKNKLLNVKSELTGKCRHIRKLIVGNSITKRKRKYKQKNQD